MTNLTDVSAKARKVVQAAIFTSILIIIGQVGFSIIKRVWTQAFPPPPPAPTVAFGKLPPIILRNLPLREGVATTYTLETLTGQLPSFPDKFKVYEMVPPKKSLLSTERTENLAKSIGFEGEPKILSSDQYVWENPEAFKTIKMNVTTKHFSLATDLSRLEVSSGQLSSETNAATQSINFLSGLGILDKTYTQGAREVTLFKLEGGMLSPAISVSEADLASVDFYRFITEEDSTQTPILGPNPKEGLIRVLTGISSGKPTYPRINYTYWEVDTQRHSTYPLKNIADGWKELEQGQAKLAYLNLKGADPSAPYIPLAIRKVSIYKIYLAYFESTRIQNYLQPIFVFEGEAELDTGETAVYLAYTHAISPEWVE